MLFLRKTASFIQESYYWNNPELIRDYFVAYGIILFSCKSIYTMLPLLTSNLIVGRQPAYLKIKEQEYCMRFLSVLK